MPLSLLTKELMRLPESLMERIVLINTSTVFMSHVLLTVMLYTTDNFYSTFLEIDLLLLWVNKPHEVQAAKSNGYVFLPQFTNHNKPSLTFQTEETSRTPSL